MAWGGLFGKKTFLDPEDEKWHFDTWRWMLRNVGGVERLKNAPLVRATPEFFPPTDAVGHARAEHIFARVKHLAGLSDWPCTLVAQPVRPSAQVNPRAFLQDIKNGDPAGTFSMIAGEATITYAQEQLAQPASLIAVLAHELAHYVIATVHEENPGGEELHEFATDLTTIYLGFGLFSANYAFNYRAWSGGWQTSAQGYLGERDWVFGLATFSALRGEGIAIMRDSLKAYLYADLTKADRYLKTNASLLSVSEDG